MSTKCFLSTRGDVPCNPLVLWFAVYLDKARAVVRERPLDRDAHFFHPHQVFFAWQRVIERAMANPDVVGGRRYDDVNRFFATFSFRPLMQSFR